MTTTQQIWAMSIFGNQSDTHICKKHLFTHHIRSYMIIFRSWLWYVMVKSWYLWAICGLRSQKKQHGITMFWTFGPTPEPWGQSIVDTEKPDDCWVTRNWSQKPWCFFRICVWCLKNFWRCLRKLEACELQKSCCWRYFTWPSSNSDGCYPG